jgi:uncharacterized protein YbbC (DUF1343 family)
MPDRFVPCLLMVCLLVSAGGCALVRPEPVEQPRPTPPMTFVPRTSAHVIPGVEVLLDKSWMIPHRGKDGNQTMVSFFDLLLKDRTVGLLTNPTGVDSRLRSTIDLLHEHPEVRLGALFAPEHGIRGDLSAGEAVTDFVEPKTGVTVFSIYRHKPTEEMLAGLDAVLYDIQDIGASSYTYIYAMAQMMAACAKADLPFIVLDRPNPAGADFIDGPVLDTSRFFSGIGQYDIAYMYGMTPGELALLINQEFLDTPCKLSIVPMANYARRMRHQDTGLPWVPTSTHIPQAGTALHYSLTGVIGEIGGVNTGVGYTLPFECLAAPWIDRDRLVAAINARNIPGLRARPISFQPRYAAYTGQTVHGAHLMITDPRAIRPLSAQITLMEILQTLYPERAIFSRPGAENTLFDKALGTDHIRLMLAQGASAETILATLRPRQEAFRQMREKYLIYDQ